MTSTSPEDVIKEFDPLIRYLAGRLLPRRHREDGEQQARLGLLESLDSFDPARGSIAKFARTAIRNTLLEMRRSLRAAHRRAGALPDDVRGGADWGRAEHVATKLLNDPDSLLSKKQAELLRQFHRFDSRADLAAHLGVPVDRANERICRLRSAVRKLLA